MLPEDVRKCVEGPGSALLTQVELRPASVDPAQVEEQGI